MLKKKMKNYSFELWTLEDSNLMFVMGGVTVSASLVLEKLLKFLFRVIKIFGSGAYWPTVPKK